MAWYVVTAHLNIRILISDVIISQWEVVVNEGLLLFRNVQDDFAFFRYFL